MTVSDRIKNRRSELGMTQEDLAKKLGYTGKATVAKIEQSGDKVTVEKINCIAEALETTPECLLGYQDGSETDQAYLKVLIEEARISSKEDVEFVTQLLRRLKEKNNR